MKRITQFLVIFSMFVLFQPAILVLGADQKTIENIVESIQEFEYGQSLKSQRELERIINETFNDPQAREEVEKQILKALKSEKTTLAAKQFFCKKLALIGSSASLPVLGVMLLNEETTEMACYALKTQTSQDANSYLHQALGKLQGTAKIAVIHLLGERRDPKAIEALEALVLEKELDIAKAAVLALGNIGISKCAYILSQYRDDCPADLQTALADAYLQCAIWLKKESQIEEAVAIFLELNNEKEPAVIQRGAQHNLLDLGRLDIDFDTIEPIVLFDGKTFDGWNGNLDYFRIENGAIAAGNLKQRIPRNEFLCTEREFSHFELRLQCKLSSKDANAGIQIRSRRVSNSHEMCGYQADMGQHYWGALYDESRRNRILADSNKEELGKVLNLVDWNEYVIRCIGRRVQLWINGYQTVDYLEPDESLSQVGLIGLQIHSGPPSEAWYKDIEIRVFEISE